MAIEFGGGTPYRVQMAEKKNRKEDVFDARFLAGTGAITRAEQKPLEIYSNNTSDLR